MSQDEAPMSKILKKSLSIAIFLVFFFSFISYFSLLCLLPFFFFFFSSALSPPPTSVFLSAGLWRQWRKQGVQREESSLLTPACGFSFYSIRFPLTLQKGEGRIGKAVSAQTPLLPGTPKLPSPEHSNLGDTLKVREALWEWRRSNPTAFPFRVELSEDSVTPCPSQSAAEPEEPLASFLLPVKVEPPASVWGLL